MKKLPCLAAVLLLLTLSSCINSMSDTVYNAVAARLIQGVAVEADSAVAPPMADADSTPLLITPGKEYDVEWTFVAYPPTGDWPSEIMKDFAAIDSGLSARGIETVPYINHSGQMIFRLKDGSEENGRIAGQLIAGAAKGLEHSGYKLFCGRVAGGDFVFGAAATASVFTARVYKATIDSRRFIKFRFGKGPDMQSAAKRWEALTEKNTGRVVVCEINGEIVMAPVVNSVLTDGNCAFGPVSHKKINSLFSSSPGRPAAPK